MLATVLLGLLMGSGGLLDESKGGDFHPTPEGELRRSRELFARTLRASDPSPLAEAWRRLGFDLRNVPQAVGVWSLSESAGRREGRGFYLFRSDPAPPLAIQAPHGVEGDDMLTSAIALTLFERHRARVGAWSTVPRESIDLAHTRQSVFHELTLAVADVLAPEGLVVQIHGYRRDRRNSPQGKASHAILSLATRTPPPSLERAARCLGNALDTPVGFFPQVPELGALTNAQGRELTTRGGPTFLHVELSYQLRRRLVGEAEAIDDLGKCLLEVRS